MMPISYIAPQQSDAEIKQACHLVQQMTNLLSSLTRAEGKYGLLSPVDRTSLKQKGYSAALVDNLAYFTEHVRSVGDDGTTIEEDRQMIGFTSGAFNSDLYASNSIKSALLKSHAGRCAYCETLIDQSSFGDIEHFRPKAAYSTVWSPALFRPAYYQLAYAPHNLFYCCTLCNQAYKQNRFDVLGARFPQVSVENEHALLINPYQEDPRNFIRFDPVNAYAYPFDLVLAFYTQTQGWSAQQTEQELWRDPSKIPGQSSFQNLQSPNSELNLSYQSWLASNADASLRRGLSTINTLGLNRPTLIRARANHLRHLRGLVWAALGSGPDQAAAQSILDKLMANNPEQSMLTPQYISLSIDAVQTWNAQGVPGNLPWIEQYNRILNQCVIFEQAPVPSTTNEALSYMVLENELELAGQRRLVYISDTDKIYGNPQGRKAIFLAVDWDTEKDNVVLVKRNGSVRQQMTLGELLVDSLNNQNIYRIFQKNEVWVVGNFPPFRS